MPILHFGDPPNVFVCPALVSNNSTKELLYAASWRYPCSWRKYHCNWYYSRALDVGISILNWEGKVGLDGYYCILDCILANVLSF
jgi:hypothetical protein